MTSIQKPHVTVADGSAPSERVWTSPLEAPEQALLEFAEIGEVLDLSLREASTDEQKPFGFEVMQYWGADRTIRADVLRCLLVASQWPMHAKGVQLRGARIIGPLDLESATLRCPLRLEDCYLEQPMVLDYATVSLLELIHCWVAGVTADHLIVAKNLDLSRSTMTGVVQMIAATITGPFIMRNAQITGTDADRNALIADGVTVGGGVFLDGGFTAVGAVRLHGAKITGQLSCRGARITRADTDGNALLVDGVTVGDGVFLDGGFTAVGAVRLIGARITRLLNCRGATITGKDTDGDALIADRITVSGGVLLDEGFTANGAVRLFGADINGQLSCRRAHITGRDENGDALIADRITVSGGVLLDKGFTAAGGVRLARARVTGQLACTDAQITRINADGNALVADEITVSSDVLLDDVFTAAGAVRFSGARIAGSLSLDGAMLNGPVALVADGARVGQQLTWAPRTPVRGKVSLERTQLHRLDDDWRKYGAHWPSEGKLRLAGFQYDGFGGDHQATCQQRLDWIRGQHQKRAPGKAGKPGSFDAQPYEQLARVFRQAGRDTEARKIAIARRSDLRTYASLGRWHRTGNWLLDVTIKHGYKPLRAIGILLVVYFIAVGVYGGAQQVGVMVPVKVTSPTKRVPKAALCTADYPCFSPFGYAIDVTIPIIKTDQADNWRPNAAADWGWVYLAGTWVFTGVGWAFTTLAVAGYTGLVRKD